MNSNITLKLFKYQNGSGYVKTDYVQIWFKDREVGFIAPEGIFLRMYDPKCPEGILRPIGSPKVNDVAVLVQFFRDHFDAINDRYITVFRNER